MKKQNDVSWQQVIAEIIAEQSPHSFEDVEL